MGRPFTEQLTEGQAITGSTIATLNNSTLLTTAINAGGMGPKRFRCILRTGTLSGSASLDLVAQASATSGGVYTTITCTTTSPAISTITTDDGWFSIEIRSDQMPTGKPYLKFLLTETASANAVACMFVVADCSQASPGNQFDAITFTTSVVAMP